MKPHHLIINANVFIASLLCLPAVSHLEAAPAEPLSGITQTLSPNPYVNETAAERDARMAWWRDAKFGMFIHWGVYSVPAGYYKGVKIPGYGEWIMHKAKIPVADYKSFASKFNPTHYNPESWVELAKNAGMKYMVITAKHHDGFAMFDSAASKWDVVDATPYGKDLIAPLGTVCRANGLKFGLYYSQAQDWVHGGSTDWKQKGGQAPWDPAQTEITMDHYIDTIAVPQMNELMTKYGSIAALWWDTPTDMNKERADKLIATLKAQPGIIHNNRLGGDYQGDFKTPEQTIPATGLDYDWESCMTINKTWGFISDDAEWKSTKTLVRNLVDIVSKGGNYLLNVGPDSSGMIPPLCVERLQEVGAWMSVNQASIHGTVATPCAVDWNGRVTMHKKADGNTTLYLHVFDWKAGEKLYLPVGNTVTSCYLLADNKRKLTTQFGPNSGIQVTLEGTAPDAIDSVIVLELTGAPALVKPVIKPDTTRAFLLPMKEAVLRSDAVKNDIG